MKRILTTAAVVALAAAAAQATIMTGTIDVAPTLQGTTGQLTFHIPQFAPTLGTLNSVQLTLTPVIGGFGYNVANLGAAVMVTDASVSNPHGSLTDTGALGLNATWSSSETHSSGNFLASAGSFASPAYTAGTLPFNSFTIASSSVAVGPAMFVGTGTFSLILNGSAAATSEGSPGFPLFYGFYGNVGGSLEVAFNYTPVPEPSCLALIVMGGFLCAGRVVNSLRLDSSRRAAPPTYPNSPRVSSQPLRSSIPG
jgi:opacity protein-like surface antigen